MTQPTRDPELRARVAHARQKARLTIPVALFALVGLVAMALPLPQRFVAFVPLLIALGLTVRLLRFLTPRPGREKVWAAVNLAVLLPLLGSLVLQAVLYGPVSRYERCVAGAQTSLAMAECQRLQDSGTIGLITG